MIPGFVGIDLVIVELVFSACEGLVGIAPFDQAIPLGSDCSSQFSSWVGVKGVISNAFRGIRQNWNQADSIDWLWSLRCGESSQFSKRWIDVDAF